MLLPVAQQLVLFNRTFLGRYHYIELVGCFVNDASPQVPPGIVRPDADADRLVLFLRLAVGVSFFGDKRGGMEDEHAVPLRSTACSSSADLISESNAKPGQRRPAAEEIECAA